MMKLDKTIIVEFPTSAYLLLHLDFFFRRRDV